MSAQVSLARVRRARGIRGEIVVESLGSRPERFRPGLRVWIWRPETGEADRSEEIERAWLHNDELVLKLRGIDSRTEAETLRGAELRIPLEERPPAPEGEYYLSDLIGCVVERPDGSAVGEVVAWHDYGAAPLLAVRNGARELLIPFTAAYYRTVDPGGRRIVMELPEGLEDVATE